ncbi:L-lysine 6-monooxygenase [Micromonospora sp. KC606]|uniref:lysine N(6)-hydroxylase/L-ornithine N(5)-oxygenase family protein n=1 Tax=Micromonospora sp. KC606 TaxID=2530379 RepID=UPI00104A008F|nr:lysine N(6)-hydroxylase/L-ornithine N(5)-oxygenase family protein [Micromonospora sp. KC606]TDC83588.1 L-lysine 6-monooxygenase [Micromonospora sp. KC606]
MSARHSGPTPHGPADTVHDVVGVGFGPANLALAVAIHEHNTRPPAAQPVRAAFVERQPQFGWHPGMLIEGATMQVSFLKDLVTMRDPGSRFTFLCYLHERGRLPDFINQKSFFPTRVEFHDYLRWCAAAVDDMVTYGETAVAIRPAAATAGRVDHLDVVVSHADGGHRVLRTRNVVVSTGLQPRLPPGVTAGPRVWHNRDLLFRTRELGERRHRRFVVVGAGQSAAETAEYLHRTFADAEVCAVFTRYGYSPADDSPFANRIFDPAAVDDFYAAPEDVKQALLGYHGNTNYSVVDSDLIEQLYRIVYQEKVAGAQRLRILNTTALVSVHEEPDGVRCVLRSLTTGERYRLDSDAVVLATGYQPMDPRELLGPLAEECVTDGRGRLRIGRDHRVSTSDWIRAGLYLQGAGTEHSHGLTASLLSTLAVRSGEICDSLVQRRAEPEAHAQANAGLATAASPG